VTKQTITKADLAVFSLTSFLIVLICSNITKLNNDTLTHTELSKQAAGKKPL
jgi:hypothetical protein